MLIVLYGALVTRLSPFHSTLPAPSTWDDAEGVQDEGFCFCQSAAAAETPRLPEVPRRWRRPQGLGVGVGGAPWRHPPSSPLISAPPGSFWWPLGTPATPCPATHPARRAWTAGPQEGAGGARAGEVARPPSPAGARGPRGRNGEAGAHGGFSHRFHRLPGDRGKKCGHKPFVTDRFREGKAQGGGCNLRGDSCSAQALSKAP